MNPHHLGEDPRVWVAHRACRSTPDTFRPLWDDAVDGETAADRNTRHLSAVAVCAGCPVAAECRDEGETHGYGGVWGGVVLAEHGTEATYIRHRRADETPCDLCLAGHAARVRHGRKKAA